MNQNNDDARAVCISQQRLDQAWEDLRELLLPIPDEQFRGIWALTRRTTPPTFLTQTEWTLLTLAAQVAMKQCATNEVRRQMEEPSL